MPALKDNSTPSQYEQLAGPTHAPASSLATSWAQGRRRITPRAYPYLRALAAVRLTVGLFLVGVGAVCLSHDHSGYAAIALAGAALCISIGCLDGAAARSVHPRS